MQFGEHVDFLVLFVQQVLEITHLGFQDAHALFQTLGVASGKCAATELIAGAALEANVGTLGAAGANTVASYFFASASVTGLGDATL